MAKPTLLDYRKQGLDLRKSQADLIRNKPNPNQPLVEALDEVMQNNKQYKPNSQALGEGIVTAAKAYFKGKDADKKIKMFETLEDYTMAAQQQNDLNEQKEQERETLEPYAKTALDLAYSGMPYDQANERMRNIFNAAKQTNPDLVKGDYIGFNPNTPFINYRDENGNLSVFDSSQAAGEEATKRVQGNYLDQQKINLQAEANQLSRIGSDRKGDQKEQENYQNSFKYINETLAPPLEAANNTIRDGTKLLALSQKFPGMFQSLAAIHWNNPDPSYWTEVQRRYLSGSNTEQDRAIGMMIKGLNKMKVSGIKGVPGKGLNQWFEGVVAGSFPNMNMSKEAFTEAMMDELNNAKAQSKKYATLIGEYDTTPDKRIAEHFTSPYQSTQNTENERQIQKFTGEVPEGTVLMRDPVSGQENPVALENIQNALNDDYEFVSDYVPPSSGKVIKKNKSQVYNPAEHR
jgi:hypothetical protein